MTTTMVKRAGALLPLAAALGAAFPAQASWDFTPTLGARATWSDNIALRPDSQKESGAVYELAPGFVLRNDSPSLKFNLNYARRMYAYSGGQPLTAQDHSQDLNGDLKARLVQDMLYFDASAAIHQQAVSPFGPQASDNRYTGLNTNEVRTWRLSPYLVHRFGGFANGTLRYTRDSVGASGGGMLSSEGDTLLAQLASGSSFRRVAWDGMLSRHVLHEQLPLAGGRTEQTTSSKNANLNLRYVASERLNVGLFGGYDDYDFQGLGGRQSGSAYGASVQWTPSARTSLEASAGHRFYGPSYALALQHRSRGTVWSIRYSDAVSTTRSQFLFPSAVDTATLLDRLFSSQISDPALRAAAVQAYIKSANLPPALASNINFFSNRYALDKQLTASMGWQMARTTSLLSVFKSRREALSLQHLDNPLLGSNQFLFNENIEQAGASLTVSYRLGAQTMANLSGSASNVQSLTDARRNQHRELRLGLARSLGQRLAATLELRHIKGGSGLLLQDYTENAVSAAITSKF